MFRAGLFFGVKECCILEATIRVLLVDDEEQFVRNMARILKFRGLDVSTALDGNEAMKAIKYGGGFDVVVLDIKMPGTDGIEVLGEIKNRAPDTEVIMLTGHATLESGVQAMRKGAYDYLMKPCDVEDLVEKIREAYEAESIKRHPVLWPRKLVRDAALHDFSKLKPGDPLFKALEVMSRETGDEALEEVFILDAEKRLKGVVTKRDLLDSAGKTHPGVQLNWTNLLENPEWLPVKTLADILHSNTVTTPPNAYLTDAANQMIMNNVRSIPVVRSGKVIGVLRLQDVFHYLDHEIE
jgi:ActR/RegA family two-component response regulator/CBS domain-containing protein